MRTNSKGLRFGSLVRRPRHNRRPTKRRTIARIRAIGNELCDECDKPFFRGTDIYLVVSNEFNPRFGRKTGLFRLCKGCQ
jgi:hypothetical protein